MSSEPILTEDLCCQDAIDQARDSDDPQRDLIALIAAAPAPAPAPGLFAAPAPAAVVESSPEPPLVGDAAGEAKPRSRSVSTQPIRELPVISRPVLTENVWLQTFGELAIAQREAMPESPSRRVILRQGWMEKKVTFLRTTSNLRLR